LRSFSASASGRRRFLLAVLIAEAMSFVGRRRLIGSVEAGLSPDFGFQDSLLRREAPALKSNRHMSVIGAA
jgi:hypothetical protein